MESLWEYIPYSQEVLEDIWKKGTFVFDTNILLNLYRFSSETRNQLLSIIRKNLDRCFFPYQVVHEFLKNRINIVYSVSNEYSVLRKEINNFIDSVTKLIRADKNGSDIQQLVIQLDTWFEGIREKNVIVQNHSDDKILSEVLSMFAEHTGEEYEPGTYMSVVEKAKERYKAEIPPGYKDDKKDSSDQSAKYGDYIIWRQIIDFAKEKSQDIIFVTNDKKDDWWNIVSGHIIGPRIELRKEFFSSTKQRFHMYTMDQFLKYSGVAHTERIAKELRRIEKRSVVYENPDLKRINMEIASLERANRRRQQAQDPLVRKECANDQRNGIRLHQYENLLRNIHITNRQIEALRRKRDTIISE